MRNFILGFFISAIICTSFGYWWAWNALTPTYELRLAQKEMIIDHYRNHWTPIRESRAAPRQK